MRILLSNDDGYQAAGIRALWRQLKEISVVSVVAPDRNRSGASNSLTLDYPVRALEHADGFISVDGTPTDCVHLAITGLLDQEPDMVVAGVNAGANLGDDVIYSGTVAAAVEGRFLGLPAIAVSLAGEHFHHFDTAAYVTVKIIEKLQIAPLPIDTILNINVPDVPLDQLNGMVSTRLGSRHKSEPVVKHTDPRGRTVYWVGPVGAEQEAGPGTDFYAIAHNTVSVTSIQVDLTRHEAIAPLSSWLADIKL